jgi:hypothetical protein
MGLSSKEFDRLHYNNQLRIVSIKGIPVIELKLWQEKVLVLYSVYNFFIEAVVDKSSEKIIGIERLTLDQVVNTYCEDIPSF